MMILRTILTLAFLSTAVAAQTSPVKNTGCPNAAYPTMTAAKVNQNCTVTFPKVDAKRPVFIAAGFSSGNTQTWNPPLTCVKGCGFYPALSALTILQFAPATTSFTFKIPNDRSLFQQCFALQTAEGDTAKGCILLHGCVTFCIGL